MSTNSINNFSFDPDKYNVENLNNKSEKEVKEIIINFCNDASNYADHVWDDGELEDDGSLETYKIVTTMRKNSLKGLVSIESPLGKQLLGHKVGDRVTIIVNSEISYDVTIMKIENTGLTEEDTIRDF